jgi:hypothetical protein
MSVMAAGNFNVPPSTRRSSQAATLDERPDDSGHFPPQGASVDRFNSTAVPLDAIADDSNEHHEAFGVQW